MTLPPLPDLHPGAGYRAGEVREMLQAYGQQCAKLAALEKQEPVAWAARALRTAKFAYIWHEKDDVQGWINLQHQSNDDGTWRGPIALYAAAGAASVPEGWQLVPVEPTQEMLEAADHGRYSGGLEAQYRNMLAAAPKDAP